LYLPWISSVGIAANLRGILFRIQKLLDERESIRFSAFFAHYAVLGCGQISFLEPCLRRSGRRGDKEQVVWLLALGQPRVFD
jgi:hypothetical protein